MIQISVKSNFRDLAREFGKLPATEQPRVIAATLNKAGAKGRTVARRAVARWLDRTQKSTFRSGTGRRVDFKRSTARDLTMVVYGIGRPFNLNNFSAVQSGDGVSATVFGRARHVPGAFILPTRGSPVVRRDPSRKANNRAPGRGGRITKHNMALTQIFGSGVADVLRTDEVEREVVGRVTDAIREEYPRAIKGVLAQIQRRIDANRGQRR